MESGSEIETLGNSRMSVWSGSVEVGEVLGRVEVDVDVVVLLEEDEEDAVDVEVVDVELSIVLEEDAVEVVCEVEVLLEELVVGDGGGGKGVWVPSLIVSRLGGRLIPDQKQ